jgi:signal transduction histidine kinase/ActR/RegA family two-component response regulator
MNILRSLGQAALAVAAACLWTHGGSAQTDAFDRDAAIARLQAIEVVSRSDPNAGQELLEELIATAPFRDDADLRLEAAAIEIMTLTRIEDYSAAGARSVQALEDPALSDRAPELRARIYYAAGTAFSFSDLAGPAFDNYLAAREIWSALGSATGVSSTHEGMAKLRRSAGDVDAAIEHYEDAWALIENEPTSWPQFIILNNLGSALNELGRTAEARAVLEQAVAVARALDNERGVMSAHINLAETLALDGDLDAAEALAQGGLESARRLGLRYFEVFALQALATIAFERGALEDAKAYAEDALSIADVDASPSVRSDIHDQLAGIAGAMGDYEPAYRHLREHERLHDAITSEEERREEALLRSELNLADSEREIEALMRERELARAIQSREQMIVRLLTLVSVLGLVALVVSGLLYREQSRAKRIAEERAARLAASEERANAASAAKSEFLAVVSHEIRTPLNGVIGMAQVLAGDEMPPKQREQVNSILEAGRMLMTILNDVLDLSKIEAGKLEITRSPENLRTCLAGLVSLWTPRAKEKRNTLLLTIAEDVPATLEFDAVRVRQCVSNLISNAVKFTDKGTVAVAARVRAAPDGDAIVTIDVADTGIGMSEDVQVKLFGSFVQADGDTARRFGGTGLGLSITRNLARMMDGDVAVESAPGAGSTFTLTFRAGLADGEVAPEPEAASEEIEVCDPAGLGGKRLLVVDDNKLNRDLAYQLLTPAGALVWEASDGREALAALAARPFDLVLLDAHMPVMDGKETIRRIRASGGAWASVPVIAVTGDAMKGDRERFLAMGMNGHVSKPIDLRELLAEANRAIAAAPPRREAERAAFDAPPPSPGLHMDVDASEPIDALDSLFEGAPTAPAAEAAPKAPVVEAAPAAPASAEVAAPPIPEHAASTTSDIEQSFTASMETIKPDWLASMESDLKRLTHALARDNGEALDVETVFRAAHDWKGQAHLFGYAMAGLIAADLCERLRGVTGAIEGADKLAALRYLSALSIIFARRIEGDGGSAGREIRNKLAA